MCIRDRYCSDDHLAKELRLIFESEMQKAESKTTSEPHADGKPPQAYQAPRHAEVVAYLTAVTKPARDAATLMPRISAAIEAGPTFEKLSEILGEPDLDIGSGIHIFVYRLGDGTGITVGTPDKKKVMYIEHANKRLFPVEKVQGAGSVVTAPVAAGGTLDVIDKIRVVLPAGWEVGQPADTPDVTVTRKAAIPPGDLAFKPIPSSPAFGEGSASHAKTNGIRVWFTLEPVGTSSAAEYEQRTARNAEIRAQLEPLRKKIERIPGTPGVKPGLLSRTPRNEEEKSWLAEYADVSSKRQILPTHHLDSNGFLVTMLQSYYGAQIAAATVRDEVDAVRKAIETVLVPYTLAIPEKGEYSLPATGPLRH